MYTHGGFMLIIAKSPQYFKIIILQLKLINLKKLIYFNRKLITLQYGSGFFHTLT